MTNGVLFIGGREIDLPFPAKDSLRIEHTILVLLKGADSKSNHGNIRALNDSGEKLWDIQPSTYEGKDPDPYVSIQGHRGRVLAATWFGLTHEVDIANRSVKCVDFNRF